MELDMDKNHWAQGCPKYDCNRKRCECGLRYVSIPAALGDDSASSQVAPKNGAYSNSIVRYEANGAIYIYSTEGVPTLVVSSAFSNMAIKIQDLEIEVAQLRKAISNNSLMPVDLTLDTSWDGERADDWLPMLWSSDYAFGKLAENPSLIRIETAVFGEGDRWLRIMVPLVPVFATVDYVGAGDERYPDRIRLGFYPANSDPDEEQRIDRLIWVKIFNPENYPDNSQHAYIGWVDTNIAEAA